MLQVLVSLSALVRDNNSIAISMESLTIMELNDVLVRVRAGEGLGDEEIDVLHRGTQINGGTEMPGSEMANVVNQIWVVLLHGQTDQFWNIIGKLAANGGLATKSMALTIMAKRIAMEGHTLTSDLKINLATFLYQLQQELVVNQSLFLSSLRTCTCQALVALLRVEWRGIFTDYVVKMVQGFGEMTTAKKMFMLEILTGVVTQGFGGVEGVTVQEEKQFKIEVRNPLHKILYCASLCLKQSEHKDQLIPKSLILIRDIISFIPPFELFNGQLLQSLQHLLSDKQHFKDVLICVRQIFSFKEGELGRQYHAKIAKKLLSVLQHLLYRCGVGCSTKKRWVSYGDRQSESTEDSFGSMITRRTGQKSLAAYQLVELLHLYFERYVPYMMSVPDRNSLDLQSSSTTKLYFQHQLYQTFASRFWQFLFFLTEYGYSLSSSQWQYSQSSRQQDETLILTVKYIFQLAIKLKLSFDERMQEFMRMVIVRLTPFDSMFKEYYERYGLIGRGKEGGALVEEISQEYYGSYLEMMKIVMSCGQLTSMFYRVVYRLLEEIAELFDSLAKTNQKEQTIQIINTTNRLSWAIVLASTNFTIDKNQLSISKICGGYLSYCHRTEVHQLIRCLSINMKFMYLCGGVQFYDFIMSPESVKEDLYEMHLLIVARVCLRHNFGMAMLGGNRWNWLDSRNYRGVLKWVHDAFRDGSDSEGLQLIFPAMFRICALMVKEVKNSKDPKQKTKVNEEVKQILNQLLYYPLKQINSEMFREQLSIVPLRRLNTYLSCLSMLAKYMVNGYGSPCKEEKKLGGLIKYHIKLILEEMDQLRGFYAHFSQVLVNQSIQSFQIKCILTFREHFHDFVGDVMRMNAVVESFEERPRRESFKDNRIDGMRLFEEVERMLSQDFEQQREFKCLQYFNFEVEWLKSVALVNKSPSDKRSILADKISRIISITNQHQQYIEMDLLLIRKLQFFLNIVQHFFDDLELQIFQHMQEHSKILNEYVSSRQVQLYIDLVEAIFWGYGKMDRTKQTQGWKCALTFFGTTFQQVINLAGNNHQLFRSVAQLLYHEFTIIKNSNIQLQTTIRNASNAEVVYVFTRNHCQQTLHNKLPQNCHFQHQKMLQTLFNSRDECQFMDGLKDYRVIVGRWLQGRKCPY